MIYHEGARRLQDRFDSRRLADRLVEKLWRTAFTAEDKAFIDSILTGTPPPVTADDGFAAVELVESVYHAIRSGERVRF